MQKHTTGPWIVGQECTDLVACPEGGRFHSIDAPAGNHYALAMVVTQLSEPTPSSDEQLQSNAKVLAASPELLSMLTAIYEAEFVYGAWPEQSEIRALILKAGGQVTT